MNNNLIKVIRKIISEEFGDEPLNKLTKINEQEFINAISGRDKRGLSYSDVYYNKEKVKEKFDSNDKSLAKPEINKIKLLYKGTKAEFISSTMLSISIPIKEQVTDRIPYPYDLIVDFVKLKGGMFYIRTFQKETLLISNSDNNEHFKIKSSIDVAIKRMSAIIFMNHKINHL